MISGEITGLFATTVGGVPKPSVDSIQVQSVGIKDEIIRDKKHHGGAEKAVCLLAQEISSSSALPVHSRPGVDVRSPIFQRQGREQK